MCGRASLTGWSAPGCDAGGVRVLGVDPGLTRCGIGVVEAGPGRTLRLVHVEVARSGPDEALEIRLEAVFDAVRAAIAATRPDAMAVERVFSQQNLRSVMGTAQASGVAILAGRQAGLPVALHTPTEVKAAVTGSGQAGKDQVAAMVRRLLRLEDTPRPADASDSLALAICHLWQGRVRTPAVGSAGSRGPTPAQLAWARAQAQAQAERRVGGRRVGGRG